MIAVNGQRDALAVAPPRSESLVAPRIEIIADFGDPAALVVDTPDPSPPYGGLPPELAPRGDVFLLMRRDGSIVTSPFPDIPSAADAGIASYLDGIVATVVARIDAAQALLTESLHDANQAIADAQAEIATIQSEFGAHAITIESLVDGAASFTEQIAALQTSSESMAGQVTRLKSVLYGAVSQISYESYTRVTQTDALAASITTLSVSMDNANAAITLEQSVRASADSALAVSIATVATNLAGLQSSVTSEILSRTTADSALAASITTTLAAATRQRVYVQGTAPSGGSYALGDLWFDSSAQSHPYYWNGTGWADNSDGRFATISASVTTETAARVSADSAIATSITAINTTLGSHSASIATLITSVDGLAVQWAVKATLNGVSGHLEFDGLQLADGSGTVYVFDILANVNIHGDLVVNGTVIYSKLGSETATAIRGTTFSGAGLTSGATTTIETWTFSTPIAGNTLLTLSGVVLTPDSGLVAWALYVDSVSVANGGIGPSNAADIPVAVPVNLATGSHTVVLQAFNFGGAGATSSGGQLTVFVGSK